MPKIRAGNITMNYDQQGSGEPLVLIPYLAADYACYAFQVADYSKDLTCISVAGVSCGFKRSTQQIDGIVRRVSRSLVSSSGVR